MKLTMPRPSFLRVAALVLCTGVLGGATLHAQDAPPPPPQQQGGQGGGPGRGGPRGGGPEQQQRQLDMMTRQLALTPDQVTAIKAIQEDGRKQQMALRDDTSTAGPDKRAKMMAMREAEQTKIKATLTDAQRTKYDSMVEQMRQERERRQEGSAPPPPPPSN